MRRERKGDWVVITEDRMMHCQRCGEKVPVQREQWTPVDEFVARGKGFVLMHSKCKEKKKE